MHTHTHSRGVRVALVRIWFVSRTLVLEINGTEEELGKYPECVTSLECQIPGARDVFIAYFAREEFLTKLTLHEELTDDLFYQQTEKIFRVFPFLFLRLLVANPLIRPRQNTD